MAFPPLIFGAMPPLAARRRPAQFALLSVLKCREEPAECSPLGTSHDMRVSANVRSVRHELPLPATGCTRARSSSNGLISRNSRSARSASASSKGRSCRHCSDRRKSQAGRNSASRHRTRNNLGLDRYTKGAGCGSPCAKPKLSGRQLEGRYSVADDSPPGSRIRASAANAVSAPSMSLPSRARSIIATCSSAISRSTTTARSAPACRARSASSPSIRCTGRKRRIVKRIVIW